MAMGMAQATYENGQARIELSVTHLGAMGAMSGMAVGMGVTANSQTEDGYERVRTENGVTISETYSRSRQTAAYSLLSADGTAVQATGYGVAPAQVEAAARSVPLERVQAPAR